MANTKSVYTYVSNQLCRQGVAALEVHSRSQHHHTLREQSKSVRCKRIQAVKPEISCNVGCLRRETPLQNVEPCSQLDLEQISTILDRAISCERVASKQPFVSSQQQHGAGLCGEFMFRSKLSRRLVHLKPQSKVDTFVNQLGWVLESESDILQEQLRGCSKGELISLVMLWLVFRGHIAVSGPSSCWARIQGLEQQVDQDCDPVPFRCDSWVFSVPHMLRHTVTEEVDENGEKGEFALLISVNPWTCLEYRMTMPTHLDSSNHGALHARMGVVKRVSEGEVMWSKARGRAGLELGRSLSLLELLRITGKSKEQGQGLFDYMTHALELLKLEIGSFGPGIITLQASRRGFSRRRKRLDNCCYKGLEVIFVRSTSGVVQKRIACRRFSSLVVAIKTLAQIRMSEKMVFSKSGRLLRNIRATCCASGIVLKRISEGELLIDGRFSSWCSADMICRRRAGGRPTDTFLMDVPMSMPVGIKIAFSGDIMEVRMDAESSLQIPEPLLLSFEGQFTGVRCGRDAKGVRRNIHSAGALTWSYCSGKEFRIG